jgi:AraC family transcriptional regulator
MNAVEKALWFVESHFASEITLEDLAKAGGVSRFHITRAFGTATGRSIMRYVRGRRLTEAAKALSNGAPDILSVALDAGYGSHEAFTRAFRDEFGVTPETIRGWHLHPWSEWSTQKGCDSKYQMSEARMPIETGDGPVRRIL